MSSTMSHELIIEILSAEKDATRLWLRAEMDRLVDPMLDSIFNRLKTKLTNQIERTHSGGSDCELMNLNFESNQSVNFIPQPSTYLSSLNPTSFHLNPQYIHPQCTFPTTSVRNPQIESITNTQNFNELTNIEPQIPIKHDEINESTVSNEPMTEGGQSLPESIVNVEKSNQLVNWNEEEEDDEEEEECDCDDCVNGGIEFKEEEEEEEIDNDVQLIEDDDDQENAPESSRPVKRPRLDSSHSAQQLEVTPRQVTYEAQQQQPNQVNHKRFITVHLQCAHCPNTFPEDQLNPHMLNEHSISLFRCVVKDCGQSFHSSRNLSEHINQTHHSTTTKWHCNKCPKHFSKYQQLSEHNTQYHLLGHFQCSFPSCTFTGEYRSKMHGHYKRHHRRVLKCQHCDYDTHDATNMAQHQHAHLGIKPYRCKWPTCDYSSAYKQDTLKHIHRVHLTAEQNRNQSMDQSFEPKDYLEVASELL